MKLVQTVAIALVALNAPLTFASQTQGQMSIADAIGDKGPAAKMAAKDLPDTYKAVKITLTNESVFGTMMLTQVAMRPGSGTGLLDALTSYWTTGDEVDLGGHKFLVTYKLDSSLMDMAPMPNGAPPKPISSNLILNLLRTDNIASITPVPDFKREQLLMALKPNMQDMEIAAPAAVDAQAAIAVPAAQAAMSVPAQVKTEALSNVKQIAVGQLLYCSDYDDVMPYVQNTATVRQIVAPYLRNNELWKSLNPNGGRILFNGALAGVEMNQLDTPAEIPMFYDERAWPDGSHIVAFTDGHAKIIGSAAWPTIAKALKRKFTPIKGKPIPPVKETWF